MDKIIRNNRFFRATKWLLITIITGMFFPVPGKGSDFVPDEISLKGYWKFRIGDNMEWAFPGYNDQDWGSIRVPARWEDCGFQGYDGFAWYRTSVSVPQEWKGHGLVLQLGYIDDADEVYFNGKKIGQSGTFPPHAVTAYSALREYQIPNNLLKPGMDNYIAVRVYDSQLSGGIVSGDVKIISTGMIPPFDIDLNGEWQFNKGKQYDPEVAVSIHVPGAWENQGFYNYDGYAVYTMKIRISRDLAAQRLAFLAGRIDDVDQLVVNGQIVGQTGGYNSRQVGSYYREFRYYFLPPGLFKPDQENLVEIRVLDTHGEGGIVEGQVGIITQDKFRKYWKDKAVWH